MNIIGLILAIAVLIFLICKGCSAILSSLIASVIAGLFNGFGIWETLTGYYVPGFLEFAGRMFFVFLLATVYGKLMGSSYSAHRIAFTLLDIFGKDRVILVIGLATGILVYGGVSAMVVMFTVLPFAYILIKEGNVPKSLLPAVIAWGQGTFAMAALPGSPQVVNIMPSTFLNTKPTAGPILGIIAAVIIFALGLLYFQWQLNNYRKKGIGFDPESKINLKVEKEVKKEDCPSIIAAFAPLAVLICLYLCLSSGWIGEAMDSITAVNTAMFFSILVIFVLNLDKREALVRSILEASNEWTTPLFNFTTMIAFGAVVQATEGFNTIAQWLLSLPGSVYVSAFVTTNIMCGITGSGSGGETIALKSMATSWLEMGANPSALHRVVSVSSCGFDSLPHCGGITTVFGLCDEDLGKNYIHVLVTSTLIPTLAAAVVVILASIGIA